MIQEQSRETPGYLLARTCKLVRFRAHGLLEEIGLYRGQQFVLRALWEQEGIAHSEMAERLAVRPATISNMLKRMEKAGLIERRRDAEDERVSRVYLTDAGRDVRSAVERVWGELEEQAFDGLSREEIAELGRLLTQIRDNLCRKSGG